MRPPDNSHFSGQQLYGDDFSPEEIAEWFRNEEEAYAGLVTSEAGEKARFTYPYHALNRLHGYRHLPQGNLGEVLGFGSAYGDELIPLAERAASFTILDPSDAFAAEVREIGGRPVRYMKPDPSGVMPFADGAFDLLTCLGVLHHIPNVSFVLKECGRCLKPGGFMLLREPVVSMGDWRRPRPGLTRHERGIPVDLLRQFVRDAGFGIVRESPCVLPPFTKLVARAGIMPYSRSWTTRIDSLLSRLLVFNRRYHRSGLWSKFAPVSVYFVLKRQGSPPDLHGS